MQVDPDATLRAGVLAYFLRRTGSAELAWELSGEMWATARLKSGGAHPPPAWVFAVARETLCESVRAGSVPDRARRKAGVERVDLTEAGARWVRETASDEGLTALVADLQPALREAVMRPVPARDVAALAARIRVRPVKTGPPERLSLRLGRLGLAR